MRLALKSTLALLAVYAAIVLGVGSWMYSELRSLSGDLANETARLVGSEVARTITGSALDELLQGDEASRARLEQVVGQITERSGVLTSLAVLDRNGLVVAGDKVEIGSQGALPEVIFGPADQAQMISAGSLIGGEFYLAVPLKQGSQLMGYVRLSMRSQRIQHLASHALRDLLLVTLVGFLTVGGIGLMLHQQIVRRSRALAEALEKAVRGEAVANGPVVDEFSRALAVARQVGRELNEARGESQQAHHRMAALMKAVDIGVLMTQPDAGLVFASERAAELLGFADSRALSSEWGEAVQPAVSGLVSRIGQVGGRHHELAGRSGQRIKLEIYALGDNGHTHEGYLLLARSHESTEALQTELGLAMQMRGLTRFYTAFAHDLRAPLNAMVMTLELLKVTLAAREQDPGLAEEKCARYINVLNEEIQRLNRQVKTLLSHTAPPSGERRDLDLRGLVQDLQDLLAPQAKRQKVTVVTRWPEEPVRLIGYADRLKQALLNVLINALEAMPEGGELQLKIALSDKVAHLVVRDSGAGIPPEVLDSIFEMQFTTKTSGTGVGLFVARSVVEAHGGSISVRSSPGAGTELRIELPLSA